MKLKLGHLSHQYVNLMMDTFHDLTVNQPSTDQTVDDKISQLSNSTATSVSITKFMRLGHLFIEASQRPDFGLEMAKRQTIGHFGVVGFAAMTAPNLLSAMQTFTHFERLLSFNRRGQSSVVFEGEDCHIRFYSLHPYNEFNYFIVDFVLSSFVALLRWLSGSEIQPKKVEFEYERKEYSSSLTSYLGCPTKFKAPFNQVTFHRKSLNQPTRFKNEDTHFEMLNICSNKLKMRPLEIDELDQFRQLLSPMIQGSTPTVDEFAGAVGIPSWTLQRRLKQSDTTFSKLLDDTRKDMAINWLKDGDLSIGEIAWRLGYSNASGFQRAFSRWTGKPPGAFRGSSNAK